jgi:hypothetical protein
LPSQPATSPTVSPHLAIAKSCRAYSRFSIISRLRLAT